MVKNLACTAFDTLLAFRLKYPALWGLRLYKRFVSPWNLEPCAAHQHTGESCGTLAIRHLEMNGSHIARELINAQLGLCRGLAKVNKSKDCGKRVYDSGYE
jgi:hypothetical protein